MTIETWSDIGPLLPTYALRAGVALLCGIVLGAERERKDKPAGLRTILLITLGSALFMIVGNLVPFAYEWTDLSRVDPSRVAASVVTGVGFLGAGTIIRSRGSVQGLTTAAIIWTAAGIGMCAGLGYNVLALGFTGIILIALLAMDPIRSRITVLGQSFEIDVVAPNDSLALNRLLYILADHDIRRDRIDIRRTDGDELHVHCTYHGYTGAALRILEAISRIEGVHGTTMDADGLR